jgi:hypothetical protein
VNDVKRHRSQLFVENWQCNSNGNQLIGKAICHLTGSLPLPERMSISLIASFVTQPVIGESDVKASNFIAVRSHIEQLFCHHLRSNFRKE